MRWYKIIEIIIIKCILNILNINIYIIKYCLPYLKYCIKCRFRCCSHCKCDKCCFTNVNKIEECVGLPLEFLREMN